MLSGLDPGSKISLKISASIYSNKTKTLTELVKELDAVHVDYLHVDCNNDPTVFDHIAEMRNISTTPVDLHLITSEPEKYFNNVQKTEVELVTFQYENLTSPLVIPAEIKSRLGMAIVSETSIEVFDQYKDRFDFVLFMTTTPGKSGGTFNSENFKRIRAFKSRFPGKKIHVDGGVTDEVAFVLRNMGVDCVVSGNYLVNPNDSIGRALHRLKNNNITSHTKVSDFMLTVDEMPVLNSSASFLNILESIEKYNLGFAAVTESDGKLMGIISNADLRRGLIKKMPDLSSIVLDDLINLKPYTIKTSTTVTELLHFIKEIKATILFLPVVDENNKLQGVVTFNNLIKGE